MPYVDAFVMPVMKSREEDYIKWATIARAVWLEHGALSYMEARADDVPYGKVTSFPRAVQLADNEIAFVAFITYANKAARDAISGKVMADTRVTAMFADSPADMNRMIYGGFEIVVGP